MKPLSHMAVQPLTLFLSLVCVASVSVDAQEKSKAKDTPNPAFAEVEDVAGLPRVLLIGDSISIGYTVPVREALKGMVNVHRPKANCGPTSTALKSIDAWLGDGKEVHDLCSFVVARQDQIMLPADVHFTKEGYDALAQEVAAVILKAVETE